MESSEYLNRLKPTRPAGGIVPFSGGIMDLKTTGRLVSIFWTFLVLLFVTGLWNCGQSQEQNLRIMTFNVRVNLPSDGPNAWPQRKNKAASMVKFYEPQLLGLQEALRGQVQDLALDLPDYAWIGVGRDDGREQGEYMAIIYQTERLELLREGTFWLSETPDTPGRGWDAAWIRTVTWACFRDKLSDRQFYHFNTHLDNHSERARQESAKLLLEQIQNIAGNSDVVLTGDFNSTPDSETYRILTAAGADGQPALLYDTNVLSAIPHHGPTRTFTAFNMDSLDTPALPIDFIFVTANWRVHKHATLSDSFDGFFPSDHMPVLTDISHQ